jgi:hypothetical protein
MVRAMVVINLHAYADELSQENATALVDLNI